MSGGPINPINVDHVQPMPDQHPNHPPANDRHEPEPVYVEQDPRPRLPVYRIHSHRERLPPGEIDIVISTPVLHAMVDSAITQAVDEARDTRFQPRDYPLQLAAPSDNVLALVDRLTRDLGPFQSSSLPTFPPLHPLVNHREGDFMFWTFLCLPGTAFLDYVPPEVRRSRLIYQTCMTCGSYHPRGQDCRLRKTEARAYLHPHYHLTGNYDRLFFIPLTVHQLTTDAYRNVHPGAIFPFTAIPRDILVARREFNNPASTHCEYDPIQVAQLVRDE
ncbi:hypothetical protein FRC17_000835, partial [Serendipita sp. 399]